MTYWSQYPMVLIYAPFHPGLSSLLYKIMLLDIQRENMEMVWPCHINTKAIGSKPIFVMKCVKSPPFTFNQYCNKNNHVYANDNYWQINLLFYLDNIVKYKTF